MQKARLSLKAIKQIDKSDILDLLLDFPGQCGEALNIAKKSRIAFGKKPFNKIVFVGVGGSAIGADVARSYLYLESKIPINVYREYQLPACVDSSTLVFLLSYSGNTEEVLSAYKQARQKRSCLIAISSGGRLKECAERDNVTFIQVPGGLPPRCTIGYLSIIPLGILAKLGIIKDITGGVAKTIEVLEELKNNTLKPSIGIKDNIAKKIGSELFNKFIIVYSGSLHFDVCATRFRAQLAENSKALASSHVFPEMCHSEIVGWQNPNRLFKDFAVLVLRDKGMNLAVAKSMDISEGMLKKENINILEVWSRGDCLLSRIFSLIYIGDFISYYLAILYGVDPEPIDRIAYLKDKLLRDINPKISNMAVSSC